MAVDPISWAVNYGLTTLARGTFDAAFKSLSAKLENTVSSWSNELPTDVHFNAEALFDDLRSSYDLTDFPARAALRREFEASRIPTKDIWLQALLERWQLVSRKDDVQPFFKQPIDVAEPQLRMLSERLETVCAQSAELFQATIYRQITELAASFRRIGRAQSQMTETEADVSRGFDNDLIGEISIAGYVTEISGIRRAIYLDRDFLYVHRKAAEDSIMKEFCAFSIEPQARSKWISIVGDAGHGKSSLLWYLFTALKGQADINIFSVFAQLSGSDVIDRLERGLPFIKNNVVLFIDTLDLLIGLDDARLSSLLNSVRNAGHLLITTSRGQEIRRFPLRSDIEIKLGRFQTGEAREAILNYIRTYYSTKDKQEQLVQFEKVWNILDSRRQIQELDLEPLILSMIFQSYAPAEIPQDINTQKVYQNFWQERVLNDRNVVSAEDRQLRTSLCLLLAHHIAFSDSGSDSYDIGDIGRLWESQYSSHFPHRTLESLVSSGILHWSHGRARVRFFHQTFLEYTAATHIRLSPVIARKSFLADLLNDFAGHTLWRIQILKQVAIQDFYEGDSSLWREILQALAKVRSLYSLHIALEIVGKLGDEGGEMRLLCRQWIAEQPEQLASTVCESVKYYPQDKVGLALDLLEPCLSSHEEDTIYNICGNRLAVMDATAVHRFLLGRLSFVLSQRGNDDSISQLKNALVNVFGHGVNEVIEDLAKLFPSLASGQKAGLLNGLSSTITIKNAAIVGDFCDTILDTVLKNRKGEVRYSFINLLEKLNEFASGKVESISLRAFTSDQWRRDSVIAIFTGMLVGRFLLSKDKITSFLCDINSEDPYVRLLSTWALLEPEPSLHTTIMDEIMKMNFSEHSEDTGQMIFKVVSNLTTVPREKLANFLHSFSWPNKVVMPNEFRKICSTLATYDEQLTKKWLLSEITEASGIRLRQLMNGVFGLIARSIIVFTAQELDSIYRLSQEDKDSLAEFADIAGLYVYVDAELSSRVFHDLLSSRNQNLKTGAVLSLKRSVNDHLSFTLSLGEEVISLLGNGNGFGLLHCFLDVLREYHGDEATHLIEKLGALFDERYMILLGDENSLTRLLAVLKIHARKHPKSVLQIARRCQVLTPGIAGALSALYANIAVSLDDFHELTQILYDLLKMAKSKQNNMRNALKATLPLLSGKIGYRNIFEAFFKMYKDIKDAPALEDTVKAIMGVPEWSEAETTRLLADLDLPAQVRSFVLSKALHA